MYYCNMQNTMTDQKITKICDGIVVIRNCLTMETQNEIIKRIIKPMVNSNMLHDQEGKPNFSTTRGRHYCNIDDYGEDNKQYLKEVCDITMANVRSIDQTIPESDVSHLLTLCYVTQRGIGWHSDDGKNDGDTDTPVISFTIGNSCDFGFKQMIPDRNNEGKLKRGKKKESVRLDSGDVIVFGGTQRLMIHAVTKVYQGTVPDELELDDDVRINLTFREAKSIIGQEDHFDTDKYKEREHTKWTKRAKQNK